MYGLVNQSIKELITENFGEETWIEISNKSDLSERDFISFKKYDDFVTYKLIEVAAQVLKTDAKIILSEFGKHWITHTGLKKYRRLLDAGGKDLRNFMIGLPAFHSRIMLMFPEIEPPEFRLVTVEREYIDIEYQSSRHHLVPFVEGLYYGLAEYYKEKIVVETILEKSNSAILRIKWL